VYGSRKKIRYTDGDSADFPAAILGSGRAALNRFGRVIAIPPLRFHATFAATSADFTPFSLAFSAIASRRPPCGLYLIKYKSRKKLGIYTHISHITYLLIIYIYL